MNITFSIEVDRNEALFNDSTLTYLELSVLVPTSVALVVILYFSSAKNRGWIDMQWYLNYKEDLCSYVAPPRLISLIGCISVVLYGYGVTIFNKTSITSSEEWGAGGGALENIPILDRHALFFTILVLSYLILGLYIIWLLTFFRKINIKEDRAKPKESTSDPSSISSTTGAAKPTFRWILKRRHEVLAAVICLGMSMSLGAVTLVITFFVTYKSFLLMTPYLVWIGYLSFFTVSYLFFLNNKTPQPPSVV